MQSYTKPLIYHKLCTCSCFPAFCHGYVNLFHQIQVIYLSLWASLSDVPRKAFEFNNSLTHPGQHVLLPWYPEIRTVWDKNTNEIIKSNNAAAPTLFCGYFSYWMLWSLNNYRIIYSRVPLYSGHICRDITFSTAMTMTEGKLNIRLTKDAPYLALTGDLWGLLWGFSRGNWPSYNGTTLYF